MASKQLRQKDLDDSRKNRPHLRKSAHRARVEAFLKTERAQKVARSMWKKMKPVCKEVLKKKGGRARS